MKNTEFYLNRVTQTDYRGGFKKKGYPAEGAALNLLTEKVPKEFSEEEKESLKGIIKKNIDIIIKNLSEQAPQSKIKAEPILKAVYKEIGLSYE